MPQPNKMFRETTFHLVAKIISICYNLIMIMCRGKNTETVLSRPAAIKYFFCLRISGDPNPMEGTEYGKE